MFQQSIQLGPKLIPTELAFYLLTTKLRAEGPTNKQELSAAAVKAWQSISREETHDVHGFQACSWT